MCESEPALQILAELCYAEYECTVVVTLMREHSFNISQMVKRLPYLNSEISLLMLMLSVFFGCVYTVKNNGLKKCCIYMV